MNAGRELAQEALEARGKRGECTPVGAGIDMTYNEAKEGDGCEKGGYVTLSLGAERQWNTGVAKAVQRGLNELLRRMGVAPRRTLVVGLGNRKLLCDRLGGDTVDRMRPDDNLRLFCPMVREQTGMDTADVVSAVAEVAGADLVVAVDALVCREPHRLTRTVQLSSAAFVPGGGVGVPQKKLSADTLGIPFVSVGVPMLSYVDPFAGTLCVTAQDIERQGAVVADVLAAALLSRLRKETI